MQSGQSDQLLNLSIGTIVRSFRLLHQSRYHSHVFHSLPPLLKRGMIKTHDFIDIQKSQISIPVGVGRHAGPIEQR